MVQEYQSEYHSLWEDERKQDGDSSSRTTLPALNEKGSIRRTEQPSAKEDIPSCDSGDDDGDRAHDESGSLRNSDPAATKNDGKKQKKLDPASAALRKQQNDLKRSYEETDCFQTEKMNAEGEQQHHEQEEEKKMKSNSAATEQARTTFL